MEKSRKQAKRCLKIIGYIFLAALLLTMAYITYTNYNKILKETKKTTKLEKQYNELITNFNNLLNEDTPKIESINELNNIDNVIKETKVNVFKLASQVESKIRSGGTNYKIAYITFDDGPYYLTNKVLDLLKRKQVKATFFLIGRGKEKCYDNAGFDCTTMYAKEAAAGHTIANHTYSHALTFAPYLYGSTAEFINQVKKQENYLLEKTGIKTNIVRFPGGSGSARGLRNDMINNLRANGYGWVDWTAQDGDGGYVPSRQAAWDTFTSSINENIEVILFHDYADVTYSILEDAINYLEGRNYILLPLFYESVMVNK